MLDSESGKSSACSREMCEIRDKEFWLESRVMNPKLWSSRRTSWSIFPQSVAAGFWHFRRLMSFLCSLIFAAVAAEVREDLGEELWSPRVTTLKNVFIRQGRWRMFRSTFESIEACAIWRVDNFEDNKHGTVFTSVERNRISKWNWICRRECDYHGRMLVKLDLHH